MIEKIKIGFEEIKKHVEGLLFGSIILTAIVERLFNNFLDSNLLTNIIYFKVPVINFEGIPIIAILGFVFLILYIRHLALYVLKLNYPYIIKLKKKKMRKILDKDEFNMFSSIQFYSYKINKVEDTCKITINGLEFITNDEVTINGVLQSRCEFDYDIYEEAQNLNEIQTEMKATKKSDLRKQLKKTLENKGKELKKEIIVALQKNIDITGEFIEEKNYALYRILHIISSVCDEKLEYENKAYYLKNEYREKENLLRHGKKTGLIGNALQSYAYFFRNINSRNPNKADRLYATFRLDEHKASIICLVSFNGKKVDENIQIYIKSIMIEIRKILNIEIK